MIKVFNSKIVKSLFSYISALIISQVLMVLYTMGIIWWLNPEKYGLIAANYATVTMLSFLITLGLHEWLVRTIPKSSEPGVLTGSVLRYKYTVGVVWGVLIWFIMPIVQPGIYQKDLLAIIIIDVFLDSSFNLLLADLLGNERTQATSILLILSRFLRFASLGLILLINTQSVVAISLMRLFSTTLIFIIALVITKPDLRKKENTNIKHVLRQSIVFNASELFNLVYFQLDLNLLTWISGNPEQVGNFGIAINVINMIMTVPYAVVYLLLPSTIKTLKQSVNNFKKRSRQILAGFFLLGLALMFGVWILRITWVQEIIGENYHFAIFYLLLGSPLLFIRTINQFNRAYLFTVGYEKKQLVPQALSIIIKLVLGIFIVSRWSVEGLILLSIGADIFLLSGYTYPVFKHAKNMRLAN